MEKFNLINEWALNQNDVMSNLKLAEWYVENKQWAAAITHYMKCAELAPDDMHKVKYHCLMMIAQIYRIEGDRWLGVEQFCRFAKTEQPDRPEAYWLLADTIADKLYRRGQYEQYDWIQVYENAKIGALYAKVNDQPNGFYYNGIEYIYAIYCISMLRLNKFTELKEFLNEYRFTNLNDHYIMNTIYFIYNEIRVQNPYTSYIKGVHDNLRLKFSSIDKIDRSYAQVMQDMFVLTVLDGKLNGTYLEIGSADPVFGSNTKLLEELGWTGSSIEYDSSFCNMFNSVRKNKTYCMNALGVEYDKFIEEHYNDLPMYKGLAIIDYLSLDIDPARNTLEALYRMPFDKVMFNVITFEHDSYTAGDEIRDAQRKFLSDKGYVLIGKSIKHNLQESFEDWWVHRYLIDDGIIDLEFMKLFNNKFGIVHNIFFDE